MPALALTASFTCLSKDALNPLRAFILDCIFSPLGSGVHRFDKRQSLYNYKLSTQINLERGKYIDIHPLSLIFGHLRGF